VYCYKTSRALLFSMYLIYKNVVIGNVNQCNYQERSSCRVLATLS
jgi:hypothetical protein